MASKILVTGDIHGNFHSLFTRVGKVHSSKNGPFHALLCVGTIFGRKGEAELMEYIHGQKQVPLPTYFIAGDEFNSTVLDAFPSGGQLAPNLHYLGRSGVTSLELGGNRLNLAYISGVYDQSSYFNTSASSGGIRNTKYQSHYIEEDVVNVLAAGVKSEVDILLTAEWGRGWQTLIPNEKMTDSLKALPAGSPVVAKLASQIAARYHFAGTMDSYLELAPYRSKVFITRFIGLAGLDSPKKEKSLYAFNVTSFASIDKSAVPADVTPCPYTVNAKPSNVASSSSSSSSSSSAATSSSHPFPSEVQSNKRQKLDSTGQYLDPHAAAVHAGEAIGLATSRWNFAKPERGPPPASYVCKICQEPGHWIDQCPTKAQRTNDPSVPPADYVCRKCNKPGHYIRECPLIAEEAASGTRPSRPPPADYLCAKCQKPGHYIRECPLIAEENSIRGSRPPPSDYVCAKCKQPGHWIKDCTHERVGTGPSSGPPPSSYVCRVCKQAGHWIQDCEVVKKEQAEREASRQGGNRIPPPGYVCARCGAPNAHYVTFCPDRLASRQAGSAPKELDANGMPVGTQQDCWFCLATEHVSTHLILSVGNENYLALAKGALNEENVLILPIVHVSNSLELTPEQSVEMDQYKLSLRQYFRSKNLDCIMYERYIPTRAAQHMHIQIIPITRQQAESAKSALHDQAKALTPDLEFKEIPTAHTLSQANPGKQPFIVFELPDLSVQPTDALPFPTTRLIHYVPFQKRVPGLFDFPRTFLAHLIGQPDRSDWKKCTTSEADETLLVEKMKATYEPFDFTLKEEHHQDQPMDNQAATE